MDLIQIAGSLTAILVLSVIASWLFPNRGKLSNDRLLRNIKRYCPDAVFDDNELNIFTDEKAASAVVVFPRGEDGIALVTALGDRVVVRQVIDPKALKIIPGRKGISVSDGDFTQPQIKFVIGDAEKENLIAILTGGAEPAGNHAHA